VSSIREVARHVGVSISTISRVINERDGVDPKTRETVLKAIDELNYRPNLVAQGLRVKRGNLLGLVVPDDSVSFSSLMHHTMAGARRYGYNVIFGATQDDPDIEERFLDDLLRRQIDGIIFSRVSDESKVLSRVASSGVPAVMVDRTLENAQIPAVRLDNFEAGRLVGKYLAELGHTHVACIQGPERIALARDRVEGFRKGLGERNVELPHRYIFEGTFKYESGLRGLEALLKLDPNITAIWAMNDVMAYGAMKAALSRGISVPEQLSIVGMDDIQFSEMLTPSLTTVHYPFDEMAATAIELISQLMSGDVQLRNDAQSKIVVLKPRMVIRESSTSRSLSS